ncbi:GntR family transcriptional regulator [Desulfospira joergensenii]|uniref:GntR family transcriptional regulator n=1 Tax=Desulfospira joergensenii TaxID=53329 RepID=UPI0003B5E1C5|nr:GntR family transcriptional regulator [Desulfospira joergensenii]
MELEGIKIERSTTVDRVVEALKRALFDGKISPGEQLKEMDLSRVFSVSRSTVREALRVLTSDGLVVYAPNKGVMARKLTKEEVEDIFLTRNVLETAAVKAAAQCPPESLDLLRKAMDEYAVTALTGDTLRSADAHVEFHSVMVGLIGSNRLMETERSLMRDLQLVIASIDQNRNDLDREVEKHENLTQLLLNRKTADAIQWVDKDLALAKGFAVKQVSLP